MTKAEFETLNPPLQQALVSRSFFGAKYLFLDETTRVRYGFNLSKLGKTYTLERKGICWWTVAWTYATTQGQSEIKKIVEYLFWYEEKNKQQDDRCVF